jgi:uncharacterized protein (DUF1015 family)
MADVRPLPGIRYAREIDLAAVVTPPYDVIAPEAQERYYARDPHNIIRLELGREEPGDDELNNRYTRAALTFAEWRLRSVLCQEAPALYLYEQRFTIPGAHGAGAERKRHGLFARVRLEPWEAGVILPHERTLPKPKSDRLNLTRATAATLSPIMALYDDPQGELAAVLNKAARRKPEVAFTDEAGEEHRLWPLRDADLTTRVAGYFRDRQLYIADGHHRYETALAYREELREARRHLAPDDPANFTLMALTALEDPGLTALPTHRIVRGVERGRVAQLAGELGGYFELTPLGGSNGLAGLDVAQTLAALAAASEDGRRVVFVMLTPSGATLLLQTSSGAAAMAALEPTRAGEHIGSSAAWRALDVAALHELILTRGLGINEEAIRAGERVSYTRDASAAVEAVRSGAEGQIAFLLNPTPPSAVRDVARAGDRMPQKSTYFYPKLITGLLIYPLW